ncbi:MAG: stringent starvation protein A [Gammaproteobacteria bacterium RBG_16_57_12]|nr:MAG: stringent starvation protein A [Gammaproteobacteria bacterium RBG_16_57_12]
MVALANRRSVMTLFSDPACIHSHRVRIVLAEKGIHYEIVNLVADERPEDLLELNPYGNAPTLVDRDLVLYNSQIVMEYLDERFPHPPLMPVDPVTRARTRLMLYRIERDWYTLAADILDGGEKAVAKARKELRDSLTSIAPVFSQQPFFLSDECTLVDCAIAPLLWRLPLYKIDLPVQAKPVQVYADKIFKRPSFKVSLSESEKEMRG